MENINENFSGSMGKWESKNIYYKITNGIPEVKVINPLDFDTISIFKEIIAFETKDMYKTNWTYYE